MRICFQNKLNPVTTAADTRAMVSAIHGGLRTRL